MANIRRAVTGIAQYVAEQPGAHTVLVGRDPRFLGETFVAEAASILAAHGLTPLVIPEAGPTPAISYAVREHKAGGAINFTASHNPPEYNGIKFSTPDGAPALPETTKQIEAKIVALGETVVASPGGNTKFEEIDVKTTYLKRLAEIIDFPIIQKSGTKVVFDPFWGAARGYSSQILADHGVQVETVHDYRDVLFGRSRARAGRRAARRSPRQNEGDRSAHRYRDRRRPRTASASSIRTAPTSSRTTSSRCSLTT